MGCKSKSQCSGFGSSPIGDGYKHIHWSGPAGLILLQPLRWWLSSSHNGFDPPSLCRGGGAFHPFPLAAVGFPLVSLGNFLACICFFLLDKWHVCDPLFPSDATSDGKFSTNSFLGFAFSFRVLDLARPSNFLACIDALVFNFY